MASNPMQRKARNSFLLGIIITLLITGLIIVLLFLQLKKVKDEQAAEEALKVNVYTINQDVKSGQVLTSDMFQIQTVNKTTIPSNATSVGAVIDSWYLQTKEGKQVYTDKTGLYIAEPDSIIEIRQENGSYFKNASGIEESVSLRTEPFQDDDGSYIADRNNEEDKITRVYQEPLTGSYYIYKLDVASLNSGNVSRTKEYLEILNVPVVAKVDMNANTVVTPYLVVQSDEVVTDDVRKQEYNMIVLPLDLATNDYVDIRLMLPNGQDFIVVSKALVEVPQNEDGTYVADTIWVNLREDETLLLSSAIVEAYGISGAKLYAAKYTEPGFQLAATPTYVPNEATSALISRDPNIVETAMQALRERYSSEVVKVRNDYLQSLVNGEQAYDSNVTTGMDTSSTQQQTTRKKYLESLGY